MRLQVRARTRDLTESREALKKSEAYVRLLFEHSPIGLALCEMSGELVEINPAYAKIVGRSEDETKRLKYWDITPETYKPQEEEQLQLLERHGFYGPYEKEYIHKDGHLVPVRLSGRILEVDGKPHIWSAVEDISQQREVEAARIARYEADSANKAKSAFLATMSHEIRTPLNSILGMGEMLKTETELTQRQTQFVDLLNRSGEQLLALINDILDLSRIDAGQLSLEKTAFDLRQLIDDSVRLFAFKAREQGIGLHCVVADDLPGLVLGDRTKQILLNLIGNAVKFTKDGKVTVEARRDGNDTDTVAFLISDTGPGIPEEKQQAIFQPFTQGDASMTRKHGGSGLGLSICTRLLDLMGGRIEVQSRVGEGSVFSCFIPLPETFVEEQYDDAPEIMTAPAGDRIEKDDVKPRILLVEDTEENRFVIESFLKKTASLIEVAENGLIAVEKFKDGDFDLVLMDIQMPVMDGYEATRRIRAWEAQSGVAPTPIIALTAHALASETEQIMAVGCNLHLSKPVRKQVLLAAIGDLVG